MTTFEMAAAAAAAGIGLALLAFWITMIWHCWKNTPAGSRERYVWLLIVILGKLPGAFAYFLLRNRDLAQGV